jgi:hypothetical protein
MTKTRVTGVPGETAMGPQDLVVAIKGAGEMATGIACSLFRADVKHIFMMEIEHPMAVRRRVSFCEAVHDGSICVEGIVAKKVSGTEQIPGAWNSNEIPVLVDPHRHPCQKGRCDRACGQSAGYYGDWRCLEGRDTKSHSGVCAAFQCRRC